MRKSVDCRGKKKEESVRVRVRDTVQVIIKNRIDWDIKKYLTLINSMQRFYPTLMEK